MALNLSFTSSFRPNKSAIKFKQAGVSLLEFVIGLVLLSIVLLGVTLFYAGQKQQLDPVFQFRAVSLAEALAEQVLSVKYDGGNNPFEQKRCGVDKNAAGIMRGCDNKRDTAHVKLADFEQVDDFQLWCNSGVAGENPINGSLLASQLDLPRTELYQRFTVETCVNLDNRNSVLPFKTVSINISIDSSSTITFLLQRYNIR